MILFTLGSLLKSISSALMIDVDFIIYSSQFFRNLILQRILNIFLFIIALNAIATAQDTTKSLAFKKNSLVREAPFFYQPDISYQLLQQFKLIQEANAGDPRAQHELGMRLLLGEGMAADTTQAVYWVRKAASQGMISAMYNYAVLLINGWGVEWNPFEAYKNFRKAALSGMGQAQFIVALLHTDNLIIKKDYNRAYAWAKRALDNGFESAEELIEALEPNIDINQISFEDNAITSTEFNFNQTQPPVESAIGLVFLDFDVITDTSEKEITDNMLIKDLSYSGIQNILDTLGLKINSQIDVNDSTKLQILIEAANAGSPEALTILGRLNEKGIFVSKNLINAAEFYIRAIRLDSPRSPLLLWNLIQEKDFYKMLKAASDKNDPVAQFVWYGLFILSYDHRLTEFDALRFLELAANNNHLPAIIELGLNHYTGRYVTESKINGISIWQIGEKYGSSEASVRIASARVFDQFGLINTDKLIDFLISTSAKGSILSEVALGSAFENGIGVKRNLSSAVRHYRNAAQRGSRFAFNQLKRIYDSLRPAEPEFIVN